MAGVVGEAGAMVEGEGSVRIGGGREEGKGVEGCGGVRKPSISRDDQLQRESSREWFTVKVLSVFTMGVTPPNQILGADSRNEFPTPPSIFPPFFFILRIAICMYSPQPLNFSSTFQSHARKSITHRVGRSVWQSVPHLQFFVRHPQLFFLRLSILN